MIAVEVGPGGPKNYPTTNEETILAALIAASAPFNGAIVHLYMNNVSPVKNQGVTQFTEATFTGYAASSALVFGTVLVDVNGVAVLQGGQKEFVASGSTIGNNIYGAYVTDSTGATLLDAWRFADAPLVIANSGDGVLVTYLLSLESPTLT